MSPDQVPVNVVRWDGQYVAVNNRSLAVLSAAGMEPTNVVDVTDTLSTDQSDPDSIQAVVQRLREMDFQPSSQIGVRPPESNWQTPPAYTIKKPGT
jgi:hypothetical protein